MKQSKIINAYNMAEKLAECEINDKEQWEVYKLRKFLRPHYEFQQEREDSIRSKYSAFSDENGVLTGQKAHEFLAEMNAISDLDIEIADFDKSQIRITKGITCKIMEPLEDFIEFLPPAE